MSTIPKPKAALCVETMFPAVPKALREVEECIAFISRRRPSSHIVRDSFIPEHVNLMLHSVKYGFGRLVYSHKYNVTQKIDPSPVSGGPLLSERTGSSDLTTSDEKAFKDIFWCISRNVAMKCHIMSIVVAGRVNRTEYLT
ncbi:hypothetical protein CHS0354_015549 [Potamilus streckersoni]|uniref:Uncharacterized protein n=1 Tax=Potamilus streckersoni TaxID=2493646 RepID=A0AAE0SVL5_9BIVA|nr:hypothetical protein CHS0354_015549 [Potamilus streckersoni]